MSAIAPADPNPEPRREPRGDQYGKPRSFRLEPKVLVRLERHLGAHGGRTSDFFDDLLDVWERRDRGVQLLGAVARPDGGVHAHADALVRDYCARAFDNDRARRAWTEGRLWKRLNRRPAHDLVDRVIERLEDLRTTGGTRA